MDSLSTYTTNHFKNIGTNQISAKDNSQDNLSGLAFKPASSLMVVYKLSGFNHFCPYDDERRDANDQRSRYQIDGRGPR